MKHSHLRCTLAAAVAALSAVSSLAEKTTNTYTRTSSAGADISWSSAGFSSDVTASAGSDISIQIEYGEGGEKYQRIKTATLPIYLDSVIGGKYNNLSFVAPGNQGLKYAVVNDPTPFEGFFSIDAGPGRTSGIYLPDNDGAGVRTIGSAFLKGRFQFGVATGCEAILDYPFGIGMFEVNRSSAQNMSPGSLTPKGKLTVNRSPGPYSVAQVRAGTLGIVGGDDDTSAPVPGAWIRLDASVVDSFTMNENGFVTTWSDADGKNVSASVENNFVNKPLRAEDSVTGKTIVNFRGRGGAYDTNSCGSRLVLSDTNRTDVAEVFFVFRENDPTKPGYLFDKAFPRNGSANQLFSPWASLPRELAMGEFRLNGQAVVPDVSYDFSRGLNVVSASYRSGGGSVKYIAGKDGEPSVGGEQFAEIILYTNTLTAAERRHNNDYLMKKWLGRGVRDYGAVMLANGASLSVESGTARVRELVLSSDSLTKDGTGKLEIESINTDLNTLSVSGGGVSFKNTLTHSANPQPAADPFAWFDAADSASLETLVSNYNDTATTFVTSWRDKRDNGYTLERQGAVKHTNCGDGSVAVADETPFPTLDSTTGTLPMVDLGPFYNPTSSKHFGWINGNSGLSTWLRLFKNGTAISYGSATAKQGFVVFYKTSSSGNPIQSTGWDLRNAGGSTPGSRFLHDGYAGVAALGGHWTYDGTTVNPGEVALPADRKAHLGAFQFSENGQSGLSVHIFGADMDIGGNSSGGCKIAEVILYDRPLTEQERLDTERYLMAKWNCGTHPSDSVLSVGTLAFNNGTPAVIDVDGNVAFGRVDRDTTGAIVKKGSGNATVAVFDANAHDVTAVTVEGGSLSLTCDPLADAWAHLDATRADSIVYTTTAGTNYVSKWKDISGHGNDATAVGNLRPTYHVAHLDSDNFLTDSGREMPVMDFGEYYNHEQIPGAPNTPTNTAAAMNFPQKYVSLQEFYIVHADTDHWLGDGAGHNNNYNGIMGFTAWVNYPFIRASQSPFISGSAPGAIKSGYIGVNGERKSANYGPALSQLNVYTISATAQVSNQWALARRHSNQWGGQVLGEVILFQTANTEARRNAITSMLLNKWRGQQSQTPLTSSWTLGSVAVANGCSLAVNADEGFAYTATSLGGAGSITSTCPILDVEHVAAGTAGEAGTLTVTSDVTIADNAVLDVYIGADGSVGSVAITGTLTVGGSGTVRVHIPDGVRPSLGAYDIVTATQFAGTPGHWTAEIIEGSIHGTVSVGYDAANGIIRLNINPNGTVIFMK